MQAPEPVFTRADGTVVTRSLTEKLEECRHCGAGAWHRFTKIDELETTPLGYFCSALCVIRSMTMRGL